MIIVNYFDIFTQYNNSLCLKAIRKFLIHVYNLLTILIQLQIEHIQCGKVQKKISSTRTRTRDLDQSRPPLYRLSYRNSLFTSQQNQPTTDHIVTTLPWIVPYQAVVLKFHYYIKVGDSTFLFWRNHLDRVRAPWIALLRRDLLQIDFVDLSRVGRALTQIAQGLGFNSQSS